MHGDHGSGAAKRRRDRRLRMHWRHEQLTLQKALAAPLTAVMLGPCRTTLPPPPPTLPSRSSSASTMKSPAVGGQGRSRTLRRRSGWPLRADPRCCSAAGRETSWWRRSGTSICTSLSWLSKCPRSHLHPVVLAGAGFLWCRRWNSRWKCAGSARACEANVDIPVLHGCGGGGSPQDLRPRQN